MSRYVKIMIFAAAAFAAIAAIAMLAGRLGRSVDVTEEAPAVSTDAGLPEKPGEFVLNPVPKKHWLYCAALVNGARLISLDSGSPVFIQCVFSAPAAEGEVALPEAERISIDVTDETGGWAETDWTPIDTLPETVPQGQTVIMSWQATSQLPPGEYRLNFVMPQGYVPDAGLGGTYLEPASFSILETPPNDYRNGMFARQLKLLAGKNDEVLAELKELSAADSSDLSLRMELVGALDTAGQSTEARKELLELAYSMTHDGSGNRTGPVPPSIAFYLEELGEDIAAGSENVSQEN